MDDDDELTFEDEPDEDTEPDTEPDEEPDEDTEPDEEPDEEADTEPDEDTESDDAAAADEAHEVDNALVLAQAEVGRLTGLLADQGVLLASVQLELANVRNQLPIGGAVDDAIDLDADEDDEDSDPELDSMVANY